MKPATNEERQMRKRSMVDRGLRRAMGVTNRAAERSIHLEPNPLQTQRVRNYGDRAQAHRSSGDHRTEEPAEERIQNAGSDWNSEHVIDESEEEILPDVAHDGA